MLLGGVPPPRLPAGMERTVSAASASGPDLRLLPTAPMAYAHGFPLAGGVRGSLPRPAVAHAAFDHAPPSLPTGGARHPRLFTLNAPCCNS